MFIDTKKQVHAFGPEQRRHPPDGEEARPRSFHGEDPDGGLPPVRGADRLPSVGDPSVRAALI